MQVPIENSYILHEKIPGSQLIIYPKAGHESILQYAAEFAEEVAVFLGSK